jgi:hypothetical protein
MLTAQVQIVSLSLSLMRAETKTHIRLWLCECNTQATALKGEPMVASLIVSADDWIEDKLLSC